MWLGEKFVELALVISAKALLETKDENYFY